MHELQLGRFLLDLPLPLEEKVLNNQCLPPMRWYTAQQQKEWE